MALRPVLCVLLLHSAVWRSLGQTYVSGRPASRSGFGTDLPLGGHGTPLHFNIPMESRQAFASGMVPPWPAAAPFPASFPTGIWPPGVQAPGPGRSQGAPMAFQRSQVPQALQTPQGPSRHMEMPQVSSGTEQGMAKAAGGGLQAQAKAQTSGFAEGVVNMVLAVTAVAFLLLLRGSRTGALGQSELQAAASKVLPAIFDAGRQLAVLLHSDGTATEPPVAVKLTHVMCEETRTAPDPEPAKVEKTMSVAAPEPEAEDPDDTTHVPEKEPEHETYLEMDGRVMSLDQLCQEVGARRVCSPQSSASASDEVLVEDLKPAEDALKTPADAGAPDTSSAPGAPSATSRAPRKWRGRREVRPDPILEEGTPGAEHATPHAEPAPYEESPVETREERIARLIAEMQAAEDDWSWGGGEPKAAHDGCIYFAGAPPVRRAAPVPAEPKAAPKAAPAPAVGPLRSGRAWRAGGGSVASSKAAFDEDPDLAALEAKLEEGKFLIAKPVRFRPSGCFVRLPGGQEAFLPVEHMPRTDASTNAVRQTVNKLSRDGKLRVREIGSDRVSMLKAQEEALRGQELEARRRKMEEGIEKLRENYNPNKVMVGFVSSVQKNGVFVSVIDGLDALVPLKELPPKFLIEDDGEAGKVVKPTLEVGQAVQFRIIRYSWQSDGFTASMMPLAERSRSGPGARGRPRQEEELDRPPSPDRSEGAKVWAAKGYSVVSSEAALELNQWLRSKMEDKKSKKGSKAVVKSTVTYLVSIARGMNTKAVGSLDLEKNVSEKEVKQAAVELLQKDGHLKAGEQHKGVTITKNIISVKL